MTMKISLTCAKLLQDLSRGLVVNQGEFQGGGKNILERLIEDGVLDYEIIGRQRKKIRCPNVNNLHNYLHHKFSIPSLDEYVLFQQSKEIKRSDAVRAASDSKFRGRPLFGKLEINVYDEISCTLHGSPFILRPMQGTASVIHDHRGFDIPPEVTIVVIENEENFRNIDQQRYLFEGITPLFVWRYQNSTAIATWIKRTGNRYLHFGDYDPKGLHIYLAEFRNKIGAEKCSFFIPEDLDELVFRYGNERLYNEQHESLKQVEEAGLPELENVIATLKKYRKGLEQEILIPRS